MISLSENPAAVATYPARAYHRLACDLQLIFF
jgi:hypothetical protein